MSYAPIASGELFYEVHGEGPPVVLAAGLGGLGSFWQSLVEALASRFTVITYDHRGSGRSTKSPPPYTIEGMTHDVVSLMDYLHCRRVQFVGHSTGGVIGQRLASRFPERIARLVLSSTWTHCDAYFRRLFMLRRDIAIQSASDISPRLTTLLLYPASWIVEHDGTISDEGALLDAADRAIVVSKIEALLGFDGRDELSAIRCPTLVIAAQDDITIPSYFSRAIAVSVGNSRLSIMDHGGHYCPITRARDFATMLTQFLDPDAKPSPQ